MARSEAEGGEAVTDEPILTDAEIDAIEERANAATPGPWAAYGPMELHGGAYLYTEIMTAPDNLPQIGETDSEGLMTARNRDNHENDAEFMAHARTDVPRLIATIRALRKERER